MNLTQLLLRIRDILGEYQTVSREWQDDELLRHGNAAQESMWKKATQADVNYGLDTALLSDFSPTMTDLDWRIQMTLGDPPIGRIKRLEDITVTEAAPAEIRHVDMSNVDYDQNWFPGLVGTARQWFYGATEQIIYFTKANQPLSAAQTRVWYERKPPQMVRFTVPSADIAGTTLDVSILTGVPNDPYSAQPMGVLRGKKDYYKNVRISCLSANSLSPQGLEFFVTSYAIAAYPKFRFTLLNTTGLTNPGYATTWEVGPYFDEDQHELTAALAASIALLKGNDFKGQRDVDVYAGGLMNVFIETINARQYQAGRRVRYVDNDVC